MAIISISYTQVNQLVNSITVALGRNVVPKTKETYFIDQRIRYSSRGSSSDSRSRGRSRGFGRKGNHQFYPFRRRTCYICNKEGCWSTKHSRDERDRFQDCLTARKEQKDAIAYMMAQDFSDKLDLPTSKGIDQEMALYHLELSEDDKDWRSEGEAFLTSNSEPIPSSTAYQYIHYLGDNSIKNSITGYTTENFLEKWDQPYSIEAFMTTAEPH